MKLFRSWLPAALLAAATVGWAQAAALPTLDEPVPTGAIPFDINYDFEVLMDQQVLREATCYTSPFQPGVLVICSELGGGVFTRLADRKVVAVNPLSLKVRNQKLYLDGATAFGNTITGWSLEGSAAAFTFNGKTVKIAPTPIVIGKATPEEVVAKTPSYKLLMSKYEPDPEALDFLKQYRDSVDIQVYFGSWCHVCKQYLPQLLRTLADCSNRNLHVILYGLPRDFGKDEDAIKDKVKGIPCVIVSKDGREVGRIEGPPTQSYEKDLGGLLRLASANSTPASASKKS